MALHDQHYSPNGIAVSGNAITGTPATIFASTTGRLKIVSVTFIVDGAAATPVVASLQSAGGGTTYTEVALDTNAPTVTIPGFEVPSGGLQVTNSAATPNVRCTVRYASATLQ